VWNRDVAPTYTSNDFLFRSVFLNVFFKRRSVPISKYLTIKVIVFCKMLRKYKYLSDYKCDSLYLNEPVASKSMVLVQYNHNSSKFSSVTNTSDTPSRTSNNGNNERWVGDCGCRRVNRIFSSPPHRQPHSPSLIHDNHSLRVYYIIV